MRLYSTIIGFLLTLGLALPSRAQNIITTVAGTDVLFSGAGQPGSSVALGRVAYVTVDPQGRAVFSDPYYNLILRAEADGTLSVIAGNNVQGLGNTTGFGKSGGGFSGDNGPATSAALNRPAGVAYDSQGNLYIADSYNNRIRVVSPSGTISTFAGNGTVGFQDGPAATAQFNVPLDITVDSSGAVIVNDTANQRIRRIAQGSVTTIAGNGQTGNGRPLATKVAATSVALNEVEGIASDAQGNIYFSDFSASQVLEIAHGTLLLSTIASNATANNLTQPSGLAIDSSGAIYVAATGSYLIDKIVNGTLTTIAGNTQDGFSGDNGQALSAAFRNPTGVAVSTSGTIFVADRDNFRIRRIDTSKNITSIAGNGTLLFSEDGKQAIYAPLLDPFGVTIDSNGSLLVADTNNNLVRSIAASGTLTTIAGNGAQEDGDVNLAATQVGLYGPTNTNRDNAGNLLIADSNSSLLREVSAANNIITTLAGPPNLSDPTQAVTDSNGNTYVANFGAGTISVVRAGQQPTVFRSNLNEPFGLALFNNNLYYTEYGAGTVSTITTSPTIAAPTAVVIARGLVHPAGIAVDGSGNVYVADAGANLVRELTPAGSTFTISTIAGNGVAGYGGDGGVATAASFRDPFGVAVDKSGNVYIADTGNNRIRVVQAIAPALTVSTSSLTYTVNQGGAVSDPQTFNVTASSFGHLAGMLFTASASQSWISVSPTLGSTPATLQVTVDPSTLSAKTYNESVTISAPGANPPTQTVSIVVTVKAPPPPALSLDTTVLNAGLNVGGQPLARQIRVLNSGGQQPQVTAVPTMLNGSGWLTVSPGTGTASATAPATFNVTINPGNLAQGVYTGQITVTSGGAPVGTIPVNMALNAKPAIILLSSNALTFTAIKGGAAPLPKAIDMVNTGTGSLVWIGSGASLTANTPNWLSLDKTSGTLATPQTSVTTINASVNPSALGVGTYYGQIQIISPNAANSPQFVTVVLNVVDASTSPGPDISATGLVFAGVQGVNPSSQTIQVANLSSQALTYGSTRTSADGNWIIQVPTDASITAGQSASIVVQPDFTNLAPGSHDGTITLRFSDGTIRNIDVLAIVAPGSSTGTASAVSRLGSPRAASPCSVNPATALVVDMKSPVQSYSIVANQATTIQANVTDCSGNAVANSSTVLAYFNQSSGLPTLTMKNVSGASWTADWTPVNPATNVTIQIGASEVLHATQGGMSGTSQSITGNVTTVSNAPTAKSLANAASFGWNGSTYVAQAPVAPGALVSVFGSNLADTTMSASSVPLDASLAGATVTLAGRSLPILYASGGQINAQVPYDLPLFSTQQLSVQRDGTLSPQVEFVVGMAQPAIFTETQSGQGQGVIVFANSATYADVSKPATGGDFLTIYCTGLGPVQGNVQPGTAVTGPTPTTATATVTIGGLNAPVLYAGLTPGFPGLYQVNVQVPTGITPGSGVPVIITISGESSPSGVTIAMK